MAHPVGHHLGYLLHSCHAVSEHQGGKPPTYSQVNISLQTTSYIWKKTILGCGGVSEFEHRSLSMHVRTEIVVTIEGKLWKDPAATVTDISSKPLPVGEGKEERCSGGSDSCSGDGDDMTINQPKGWNSSGQERSFDFESTERNHWHDDASCNGDISGRSQNSKEHSIDIWTHAHPLLIPQHTSKVINTFLYSSSSLVK